MKVYEIISINKQQELDEGIGSVIAKIAPYAGKIFTLVNAVGMATAVYDYWKQVLPMEHDLEEIKSGKVSANNRYKGMTYEQAQAQAQNDRHIIIGKTTAALILLNGFGGKLLKLIGGALKLFPIVGWIPGMLVSGLGTLVGAVEKVGAAPFLLWCTKTSAGQAFLSEWASFFVMLGTGSANGLSVLEKVTQDALKWIDSQLGTHLEPAFTNNLTSKIQKPSYDDFKPTSVKDDPNAVVIQGSRVDDGKGNIDDIAASAPPVQAAIKTAKDDPKDPDYKAIQKYLKMREKQPVDSAAKMTGLI